MKFVFVFVLGLGLVSLAFYLAWRQTSFFAAARLLDAEVTELIPVRGSKGGTSYKVKVMYRAPDGLTRDYVNPMSSNPPMHRVGERVKLAWLDASTDPRIVSFPAAFAMPWVILLVGLFLVVLPMGFWYGPGWVRSHYYPMG